MSNLEAIEPLERVSGDLLPPVGSVVHIHLGRQDAWVPHTVTGYYAWADLGGSRALQRLFVRVKDSQGYPNARLLQDVRVSTHSDLLEPLVPIKSNRPIIPASYAMQGLAVLSQALIWIHCAYLEGYRQGVGSAEQAVGNRAELLELLRKEWSRSVSVELSNKIREINWLVLDAFTEGFASGRDCPTAQTEWAQSAVAPEAFKLAVRDVPLELAAMALFNDALSFQSCGQDVTALRWAMHLCANSISVV